jgi:KDO2-lipid IV(A) lauroyltransferase
VNSFVKSLLKLVSRLPLGVLYIFSDILFVLAYYVVRYRRGVVEENLRNSFPELSEKERKRIGRDFFHTLSDQVVETIRLMSMSREELLRRARMADSPGMEALKKETGSVLLLTGHFTNWEWAGNSMGLNMPDKKVQIIYLRLTNQLFNEVMYGVRSRFGNQPINVEQAFRQIYATKDIDKLSCFLADQCPMEHQIGYWGTFFHRETPWFTGPEKLAERMKMKVYFIPIRRLKRGYYEVDAIHITSDPSSVPENYVTETYCHLMENTIRAQPETWLWSHRRWKRTRKPAAVTAE